MKWVGKAGSRPRDVDGRDQGTEGGRTEPKAECARKQRTSQEQQVTGEEESFLNRGSQSGRSGGNDSGLTKAALGRAEAEAELKPHRSGHFSAVGVGARLSAPSLDLPRVRVYS